MEGHTFTRRLGWTSWFRAEKLGKRKEMEKWTFPDEKRWGKIEKCGERKEQEECGRTGRRENQQQDQFRSPGSAPGEIVLMRVSITVKGHHEHANSYKGKYVIGAG